VGLRGAVAEEPLEERRQQVVVRSPEMSAAVALAEECAVPAVLPERLDAVVQRRIR